MDGSELRDLIFYKTKENSTDFPSSDMLPLVNTFKDEISSQIAEKNQNYFAVPAKEDLVVNQREYAIADDMLNNLLKVEIKFTSGESRFPAKAIKWYEESETESEITARFSNLEGEFCYFIRRKAIFILSGTIATVTDGIRIVYIQYPADLANLTGTTDLSVDPTTTTAGFPKQFHELLARRVSIEYKDRNGIDLSDKEQEYDKDLNIQLNAIAHLDHNLEVIGNELSRQDQGDYGFNY